MAKHPIGDQDRENWAESGRALLAESDEVLVGGLLGGPNRHWLRAALDVNNRKALTDALQETSKAARRLQIVGLILSGALALAAAAQFAAMIWSR